MSLTVLELALCVGFVPSAAMLLVSMFMTTFSVGKSIEAIFQNFSAGLILGAVAGELFPLILDASPSVSWIGITSGFVFGFVFLNSVDPLIRFITLVASNELRNEAFPKQLGETTELIEYQLKNETLPKDENGVDIIIKDSSLSSEDVEIYQKEGLEQAEAAIALPSHQKHIEKHIQETINLIQDMKLRASQLKDTTSTFDYDHIADHIDESAYTLQYKLKHIGRLIQGSGVKAEKYMQRQNTIRKSILSVTTNEFQNNLVQLEHTAKHLVEHIRKPKVDKLALVEIAHHIKDMGRGIELAHRFVDNTTLRFRKISASPIPDVGSNLPLNLIIPVTIDCFVDGFLIGVSVAANPKAGYILAGANSLEMSFLGMAYASRISKCTGSSNVARACALYLPCILMWMAAGFGAMSIAAANQFPAVYISFVAFGITALVSLVCCELLIESRESQGEETKWWIQLFIFAGIYVVLMSANVIPE